MAGDFLAREVRCAERRAGIPCHRLNVDAIEWAARLEGPYQQNIQKNSPGEAEGSRAGGSLKICRKLQNYLFQKILGAAGQIGAKSGGKHEVARGEAEF